MADKTLPENKTGKTGGQLNNKNAETWNEERALKLGQDLLAWIKPKWEAKEIKGETREIDVHQYNVYFNKFLFMDNDYPVNIVENLSEKFQSFRDVIKKVKEIQKTKVMHNATHNRVNVPFSIFFMKAVHKMSDRPELENNQGEDQIKVIKNFVKDRKELEVGDDEIDSN